VTANLSERERTLVNALQQEFPLTLTPYADIACRLGWKEADVLETLDRLVSSGALRKFGAILNPRKMGYKSVLAAVQVPDERIDEVASIINCYHGVTHNYLREGEPNVWFALIERDEQTLASRLDEIQQRIGCPVLRMPATKVFKIGVKLDV